VLASRGRHKSQGFTLVELQVALLIMVIISSVLLGALRLSSQIWSKVTARQDMTEHQFLVSQMLRRHLSSARIYKVMLDDGETVDTFIGGEDFVHYVAPFPRFLNDGALYWWTLKIGWDESSQNDVLLLEYQAFDEEDDGLSIGADKSIHVEGQHIETLIIEPNIEDLSLEFLVRNEDRDEWRDQWLVDAIDDELLLVLLKLELSVRDTLTKDLVRSWPDIVLAPVFADQLMNIDREAFDGG